MVGESCVWFGIECFECVFCSVDMVVFIRYFDGVFVQGSDFVIGCVLIFGDNVQFGFSFEVFGIVYSFVGFIFFCFSFGVEFF